jgi:hypothetical protein
MFSSIWASDENAVRDTFGFDNVDTADSYGVRPLHVACLRVYPDFEIVSYLLGMGASIDFEVSEGLSLIDAVRERAISSDIESMKSILHLLENIEFKNHLSDTLIKPVKKTIREKNV